MLKIVLLISVVISSVIGECFEPAGVKNFDRARFSGSWRSQVIVGTSLITDVIPPCVGFSFIGSTKYDITTSFVVGGKVISVATKEVSSQGGSFIASAGNIVAKMVVLDTDYENYATFYTCSTTNSSRSTVEVFTRSRVRDNQLIEQRLAEAQKIVPITAPRHNVDQNNCIN